MPGFAWLSALAVSHTPSLNVTFTAQQPDYGVTALSGTGHAARVTQLSHVVERGAADRHREARQMSSATAIARAFLISALLALANGSHVFKLAGMPYYDCDALPHPGDEGALVRTSGAYWQLPGSWLHFSGLVRHPRDEACLLRTWDSSPLTYASNRTGLCHRFFEELPCGEGAGASAAPYIILGLPPTMSHVPRLYKIALSSLTRPALGGSLVGGYETYVVDDSPRILDESHRGREVWQGRASPGAARGVAMGAPPASRGERETGAPRRARRAAPRGGRGGGAARRLPRARERGGRT